MLEFPINIAIGSFVLPSHLVFDLLAFYFGFSYYEHLRRKKGDYLSTNTRWYILIGAAVGALIFSKLLAAMEEPSLFLNPPSLLYYIQGETIIGGILGGILGVEITKKIIKEKRSSGDLFTFPLILGMIIGRIGCFLAGVSDRTVGLPSNLPWAFDQGDGILRHPTSLYEIVFLSVFWIFLTKLDKNNNLKKGSIFKIFIFSYLLYRFIIEFIKPITPLFLGLSALQIASLIGLIYYSVVIYKEKL